MLVTPLVDNEASIKEVLTKIVGSKGEQNEQILKNEWFRKGSPCLERKPAGRDQPQQTRN